jgi:hypothetical protein
MRYPSAPVDIDVAFHFVRSRNSPANSLHGSPAPVGVSETAYPDTSSLERLHGASHAIGHTSSRFQSHNMRAPSDTTTADTKAGAHKSSLSGTSAKRVSDLAVSAKRVASPTLHGSERPIHKSNGRRASSVVRPDTRFDGVPPSVSDHDLTEADHDPTPYCYCQKQSYGEMIGCDSDDCRYEWVSLFFRLYAHFRTFADRNLMDVWPMRCKSFTCLAWICLNLQTGHGYVQSAKRENKKKSGRGAGGVACRARG